MRVPKLFSNYGKISFNQKTMKFNWNFHHFNKGSFPLHVELSLFFLFKSLTELLMFLTIFIKNTENRYPCRVIFEKFSKKKIFFLVSDYINMESILNIRAIEECLNSRVRNDHY